MSVFLEKANSGVMYLIAGVVIAFVVLMSVVFMVKAYREGLRTGIDRAKMRKAMVASATFTAVPSISILLGVIALAGKLGLPISWLRLSVIGAIQYEGVAAKMASERMGVPFEPAAMTDGVFIGIIAVMTIGIIWGALFCILGLKKYQSKFLVKVGKKDNHWGQLMFTAMFTGMVCAFIGVAFADLRGHGTQEPTALSLIVLIISAACMGLCTLLINKYKQKWLENFSLAFSMLIGMASAILFRALGVS
jgi:hypothetical protein